MKAQNQVAEAAERTPEVSEARKPKVFAVFRSEAVESNRYLVQKP